MQQQLFVKSLTSTLTFDIPGFATTSVAYVKHLIHHKTHIPPHEQRLVCEGKEMCDTHTLSHYDVSAGSTVHLQLRLLGGLMIFVPYPSLEQVSAPHHSHLQILLLQLMILGNPLDFSMS